MFREPTVFIIGAGASSEVDLPLGAELISQIEILLDFKPPQRGEGDNEIWQSIHRHAEKNQVPVEELLAACSVIRNGVGTSFSIDNFLNQLGPDPQIEFCAKLAIVSAILKGERNSRIGKEEILISVRMQRTWHLPFFRMLIANVQKSDLDEVFDQIGIVCFNYDRCVEQFFWLALRVAYGISENRAAELVKKLRIVHPYGFIGHLPWMEQAHSVGFGKDTEASLEDLIPSIQTFAEQVSNPETTNKINQIMQIGRRVIFLGFGYYKQNMDILSNDNSSRRQIFGTACGMSDYDLTEIKVMLKELSADEIDLYGGRCSDFFEANSRRLAIL